MNGKDLHDAVEFVGPDLIDLAEHMVFHKSTGRRLLPVAACLAVLLGLTAVVLRFLPAAGPEPAPLSPGQTEAAPDPIGSDSQEPDGFTMEEDLLVLFPELDRSSTEAYLQQRPALLENGWFHLKINEAGLEDEGTDICTIQGDQVLALDVENQLLLLRIAGEDYRGVLAIVKDRSRLSLQPSSQLGVVGETARTIAQAHNGILAMTGSAIADDGGFGNGSALMGYAMSGGVSYGEAHLSDPYTRLEIDQGGWFRLVSAAEPVGSDTQYAMEFAPAILLDGQLQDLEYWGSLQPRACIGQTEDGTVLMLVVEGRLPDYSAGAPLSECADILLRYGCVQAMNLDGGTGAILWYDGETITRCSNSQLPDGRTLPNAFVVSGR